MSSGRWRATATSPRQQRAEAAATPLGAIRYGSNAKFREMGGYFMEEVRRQLIKKFGEDAEDGPNSVYAGGLWVRSSMIPVMQDAAAEALREGLAKFDGGRGWRDTDLSIDVDGDWRAAIVAGRARHRLSRLAESGRAVEIGRCRADRLQRRVDRDALRVGRGPAQARGAAEPAFGYLKPGMIIIVKQMGVDSYALRSIPEVSGGMVAEEVRTGRVLAMQGGFDSIGASYNRAVQALRQPGSAFKPIVYEAALENGMTPASIIVDAPFCVWQGAGLGNKCFRQFRRPLFRRQDDALGRRAIAQPDDRPRRLADRDEQGHRQCQASSAWAIMSPICRSRWAPATRRCSS